MLSTYLDSLRKIPLLKHEDVVELFERLEVANEKGDIATREKIRKKLIESNLRLVVSIANKKSKHTKIPLEDLIQEGNLGLMTSIDKFDYRRGFRFGTYASWWIKQAIGQYIMNKRGIVRLPAHAAALQRKIMSKTEEFRAENGRNPTPSELMEATGASDTVMKATVNAGFGSVSLYDTHRGLGPSSTDGNTWEMTIPATGPDVNPFENVSTSESKEIIRDVLSSLTEKEMTILRLRFALIESYDDDDYSITEEELKSIEDGEGLK